MKKMIVLNKNLPPIRDASAVRSMLLVSNDRLALVFWLQQGQQPEN